MGFFRPNHDTDYLHLLDDTLSFSHDSSISLIPLFTSPSYSHHQAPTPLIDLQSLAQSINGTSPPCSTSYAISGASSPILPFSYSSSLHQTFHAASLSPNTSPDMDSYSPSLSEALRLIPSASPSSNTLPDMDSISSSLSGTLRPTCSQNSSGASSPIVLMSDPHVPIISRTISIKCWNIKGNLAANLTHPGFLSCLSNFSVNIFQESHLLPDQEDCLDIPPGYRISSIARTPSPDFNAPWGGVVAIFSNSLELSVDTTLSGPDLLVLDLGFCLVFNIYILPNGSPWESWTSIHPRLKLAESLTLAKARDMPMVLLGDFNARTGNERVLESHPSRISVDEKITSQGRWLLEVASDFDLMILNGVTSLGASNGQWTSYQGADGVSRRSVIDYCLCNNSMKQKILRFSVGRKEVWCDHAALVVYLEAPFDVLPPRVQLLPKKLKRMVLPSETFLDKLLIEILDSSSDDPIASTYGKVYADGDPLEIYTDGACLENGSPNARAGAGVYFGVNHISNSSTRVSGAQSNNRAELLAVLVALSSVSVRRCLCIYTDSQYVIRSIVHWGPGSASRGWVCANGDILKDIALWIKSRQSWVKFRYVKGHSGNAHNDAADELAKQGASKPFVSSTYVPSVLPHVELNNGTAALDIPKVSTDLCVKDSTPLKVVKRKAFDLESHRGRCYVRMLREHNLRKLTEARPNSGQFWKAYRGTHWVQALIIWVKTLNKH